MDLDTELTSCGFSRVLLLDEYQKLCIQILEGNGEVLIPGRVPGGPDLPRIYPVQYPGQTPVVFPGQVPVLLPGQIPIQGPGSVPGQTQGQIPGQGPGQIPPHIPITFPGQYPGHLPIQPAPGMYLPIPVSYSWNCLHECFHVCLVDVWYSSTLQLILYRQRKIRFKLLTHTEMLAPPGYWHKDIQYRKHPI